MTPVVVDASAGVEVVTNTLRGRLMLPLLPPDAELWVPEHFYAEVLTPVRRLALVTHVLNETHLTDDHRLVQAPTFPSTVNVHRLRRPSEPV